MSDEVEQRSGGLRLRVLGFPVRVDLSFVIVLGVLGLGSTEHLSWLLVWVAVGAVAILLHELGHAVVARLQGARPVIDLVGFGGVTSYRLPREQGRAGAFAVAVTGPLVGVAIGLGLLVAWPASSVEAGSVWDYARLAAVFTNLAWGLLNLLPILPLDGGQVLTSLLPGDAATRERRAAAVSVVTAALAAVAALAFHQVFAAFFAGWYAFGNLQSLRGGRGAVVAGDPTARVTAGRIDRGALWLLAEGRTADARHLVETPAPGERPDQAVHGAVLALTGARRVGRSMLERALAETPGDPLRLEALLALALADGDLETAARLLVAPVAEQMPTAGRQAFRLLVARASQVPVEESAAWLARAVALGWRDLAATEAEPALAATRALPGYDRLRDRMLAPA